MVSKKEKRNKEKAIIAGTTGTDPYAAMAPEERKKLGEVAKAKGNEAFSVGKLADAKKFFSEAIALEPTNEIYYSNRSAVFLALKKYANAIEDAKHATEMKPLWWKGYSRLGNAYAAKGSFKEAARAFARGLFIEGEEKNEHLLKGLEEAKACCNEEDLAEVTRDLALREAQAKAKREAKAEGEIQHIIGIDLGTTYSCVGVFKDGNVEIVANSEGLRTTPSIVSFAEHERLVGEPARLQSVSNPLNTVYDAKRLIGSNFSDEKVKKDIAHFPFKVLEGEGGKPMIQVEYEGATKQFSPEEISAMVLDRMKKTAEDYLGVEIKKAVITVPAYFNDSQRVATRNAGAIAGLDVKRIINEPTAAALAYGLDSTKMEGKDTKILVFDLGGGTFDVSVLRIEGGIFEVLATGGDTHLGGEDFDNNTVEFLAEEFLRKNKNSKLRENPRAMKRLRQAAEKAKRLLSSTTSTAVEVDDLVDGIDFSAALSRAKFEQLQKEPFARCLEAVKQVLTDSNLTHREIDEVVLVGGSTRIPRIQADLKEFFGGKELNKSINPDEAVAYGAAVQGAILSGSKDAKHNQLLLVDVTPLSLGIEMSGRIMSVLIKRNTPIPVRKTKTYTTEEDYQDRVDIPIYEGERACTDGNNKLGDFTITGIERAKRGVAQIEVTFDLDANGILSVNARDTKTGASADITISNDRGRLSPEEIERMISDAEKYRAQDEAHAAQIEARNDLERLVYNVLEAAKSASNIDLTLKIEETRQWLEEHPEATRAEIEEKKIALERVVYRKPKKGGK